MLNDEDYDDDYDHTLNAKILDSQVLETCCGVYGPG